MNDTSDNSSQNICSEKKLKLLIVELSYHAEVLNIICPTLAQRFSLTLWTTEKIWAKTSLDQSLFESVILLAKNESPQQSVSKQAKLFQSIDLIYFNTLEKHLPFFARQTFPCPVIVRIHNVNASLFPRQSIDWSLDNVVKVMSFFIRKVWWSRLWRDKERIYKKADLVMLPSAAILTCTKQKITEIKGVSFSDYCLPFFNLGEDRYSAVNSELSAVNSGEIVAAVTGSVDPKRKDFRVLLDAISHYRQSPNKHLRLIFLGSVKGRSGQEIIKQFHSLENERFSMECFTGYVPQAVVEKRMQSVQFLIAPIKLKTRYQIYKEYYGKTKVSGIENDMMFYRKPAILPRGYELPEPMREVSRTYSNASELYEAILRCGESKQWSALTMKFAQMHEYSKECIADQFFNVCQTLIAEQVKVK